MGAVFTVLFTRGLFLSSFLENVLFAGYMAILLLLGNWYYLTKAFFGLIYRSSKLWVYPTIAGVLFMVHAYYAAYQLQSEWVTVNSEGEFPYTLIFIPIGGLSVFVCTAIVNWFYLDGI